MGRAGGTPEFRLSEGSTAELNADLTVVEAAPAAGRLDFPSSTASTVLLDRDERDHELRSALFAIESSAVALSEHRDQMTRAQIDALARGVESEARRLRALVEGRVEAGTRFDLGDAVAPVLACARAAGLDIVSTLPRGIEIEGRPDSTAQVVMALLDNARQHAPGSVVDVRATVLGDVAELCVEDRGPGIAGRVPERIFGRGVRGNRSSGSGLGLFIARRVMAAQGGSIGVDPRPGGGASFVLRFRRVPLR